MLSYSQRERSRRSSLLDIPKATRGQGWDRKHTGSTCFGCMEGPELPPRLPAEPWASSHLVTPLSSRGESGGGIVKPEPCVGKHSGMWELRRCCLPGIPHSDIRHSLSRGMQNGAELPNISSQPPLWQLSCVRIVIPNEVGKEWRSTTWQWGFQPSRLFAPPDAGTHTLLTSI